MNSPEFVVQGVPSGNGKLLGLWQVAPSGGLAFSSEDSGPAASEGLSWSVTLPADPHLARHLVERQAGLVLRQQRQLELAAHNLRDLDLAATPEVAFTTGAGATAESPEITLRRNLAQIYASESEVAYGLRDWLPTWRKTVTDCEAHLGQILGLLNPMMRVETNIEAQQIAWTIIQWPGQLQTVSYPGAATFHLELHRQSLALVWQSRLALLQLLAKAGSGAAMLAAKLSLPFPAGPLLALPAVWRYLHDLQQQVDTLANL